MQLVQAKKGSWNERDWEYALKGVQYWKQQESSDMAWQLIDRAIQENHKGRHYQAIVSELLSIWTQTSLQHSAKEILSKLQNYPSLASQLYSDIHTITKMIDSFIKNGDADAYELAEHVVLSPVIMDQVFVSTAMNAVAKSGRSDAPQRAEALLVKMIQSGLKPDRVTRSAVIEAWTSSGQSGRAQRAEQLLLEDPNPDATMYGSVLKAWGDDSADRCKDFVLRWKQLSDTGIIPFPPTNIHYGTVMNAFAKEGRAQEAEQIMHIMMNTHEQTHDPQLIPDRIQWTTLIDANSNDPERVEQLLNRMLSMAADYANMTPNSITFNAVLKAWANQSKSRPHAVQRAMNIMTQMEQCGVPPDTTSYNTVMSCVAHSRARDAPQRAESLFRRMRADSVPPDIITFNSLIDVHAKSNARDAPERVETLLNSMTEFCEPDTISFNTAMLVWSRSRRSDSVDRTEALFRRIKSPDKFSYNALLETYGQNGNVEKAEQLLKKLEENGMASDFSFRTIMNCWAKMRDKNAGVKAETMFHRMKELFDYDKTNIFKDYTTLVTAWANSGNSHGPAKAEEYLSHLKQLGVLPDTSFYSAVINAHAIMANKDPNAILRVFTILQEMSESPSSAPNIITYNSVLKCLSRSSLEDKAFRALALIQSMEESVRPDIRTLDEVMAACAYSHRRDDAFPIALKIFRRACQEFEPTARTFGLFFLAAEEHADEVEIAYRICCQKGFQNDPHVRKYLEKVSTHLLR